MAAILLRIEYHYPKSSNVDDIRSFYAYQSTEGSDEPEIDIYKFLHPLTGDMRANTTFHRRNIATDRYETAGSIEWYNSASGRITFGSDTYDMRDCRRLKKATSKSRRFPAGGSEYKWKIAEDETHIFCVDSWGKTVATWLPETQTLKIAPKGAAILDRLIVTCTVNLYMWKQGFW
ncbi:hypothetical protein FIBSPDRAFT_951032 [Athelia psychrophila]|uniref:DUF6593 domain-containing protein n=1 Tax=Athelia psychrophila TaxID=1759441 RepID=A0A166N4E1_9AGAM|nr:hypothetical protein FIBSPDRAFT_951032 [Fibularhizoctonia sp. CBS 109695]